MQSPCSCQTPQNTFTCHLETSPSLCLHEEKEKQNSFTNADPTLSLSTPNVETSCLSLGTAVLRKLMESHHRLCFATKGRQWVDGSWIPWPLPPPMPWGSLRNFHTYNHSSTCTDLSCQMHANYLELTISWNKMSERKKKISFIVKPSITQSIEK